MQVNAQKPPNFCIIYLSFLHMTYQKSPSVSTGAFHILKTQILLFVFDFFARFLIDHFHGQAHFAAIVKAHQFDFNLLAL